MLSSQIEGTQSSLSDLLLFENDETPGVPIADVQEVSNYVSAMNHGLARLRDGFPLSLRLIREIQGILLSGGRGGEKQPVSSAALRTGSAAPAPDLPLLIKPVWSTSSSKPFIRFSMATAASAASCHISAVRTPGYG